MRHLVGGVGRHTGGVSYSGRRRPPFCTGTRDTCVPHSGVVVVALSRKVHGVTQNFEKER